MRGERAVKHGVVPASVAWLLAWGIGLGGCVVAIVLLVNGRYLDALFQAGVGLVAWSVLLTLYSLWDIATTTSREPDDGSESG